MYSVKDLVTKIKIVDTNCINATRRAENDIKNGRIVLNSSYLSHNRGYTVRYKGFRFNVYLKDELDKIKILLDTNIIMYSDIRFPYDDLFQIDCYEERMKDEVIKIHGANFIDSLQRKAIKQFVIDNPNRLFTLDERDHAGGRESEANNYDDYITKAEVELKTKFVYPKGYQKRNEKSFSYTNADFIFTKNGTIKGLRVKSTFQNTENEKFRDYFETEVIKFVEATKWGHPTFSGLIRDSEMNFIFFHN